MTAAEMKYEGEILYESIASGDAPGYTNKEWSYLLTAGQEKVIKDIIDKGLDREEKYKKAISPLLTPEVAATLTDNTTNLPNSVRTVITSTLTYPVLGVTMERCVVEISDNPVVTKIVTVKPISHDYYMANIRNPHKKPNKKYVYWRLDEYVDGAKVHVLITDIADVDIVDETVDISYKYVAIAKPRPIIVPDANYATGSIDGENFSNHTDLITGAWNCLLGEIVHRWIVQEAVNIAYASDRDQIGYQISNAENIENIKE